MTLDTQILIIGGGPAGMTLALSLAQRGIRSVVLEQKMELDPNSRAVAIWPRGLEIFESIGVLESLLGRGQVQKNLTIRSIDDHTPILSMDFASLDPICSTGFVMAISQSRTEETLLDAVRNSADITILFGATFDGFEDHGSHVSAGISHADGTMQTITADWLVGADGARSAVRSQLGWDLRGKTFDTRAFLADVRVSSEADNMDGWMSDTKGESFLAAVRYDEKTWRLIDQSITAENEADLDGHAQRIADHFFGQGNTDEVIWASAYNKHERLSDKFYEGRILLIGDAAHLNSPAGGQGMNTGLRDAHNLAWKLDLILAGKGDAVMLLKSYEEEQRSSFLEDVAPFTAGIEKAQTAPVWVRKFVTRNMWLGRALGLEEKLMRQQSMLFIDHQESLILTGISEFVGRRIPNVMLPEGRLYTLIGRYGLLLDRDGDADTLALGRELGIPVARLPRIFDQMGFDEIEALFIRPDHVIGVAEAENLNRDAIATALGLTQAASLPLVRALAA